MQFSYYTLFKKLVVALTQRYTVVTVKAGTIHYNSKYSEIVQLLYQWWIRSGCVCG